MRSIWLINFNIQISIKPFQNDTIHNSQERHQFRVQIMCKSMGNTLLLLLGFGLCFCGIVLSWIVSEVEIINISRGAPGTWLTRLIRLHKDHSELKQNNTIPLQCKEISINSNAPLPSLSLQNCILTLNIKNYFVLFVSINIFSCNDVMICFAYKSVNQLLFSKFENDLFWRQHACCLPRNELSTRLTKVKVTI